MIFWLDAQLPPSLAPWLAQAFGDRRLREVLHRLFIDAIALLEAGEQIVELGDA